MARGGVKKVEDAVTKRLNQLVKQGDLSAQFFKRVAIPQYKIHQRKRFMTENEIDGARWKPLVSQSYINWKKRKYAMFPGNGEKLLIASGRLMSSLTGDPSPMQKPGDMSIAISGKTLVIASMVPYAKYLIDGGRPLFQFSREWMDSLKKKYRDFWFGVKR